MQGVSAEDAQLAIDVAAREYGTDEVNIDGLEDTEVSVNDEGMWVQAWVFVSNVEMEAAHAEEETADA